MKQEKNVWKKIIKINKNIILNKSNNLEGKNNGKRRYNQN